MNRNIRTIDDQLETRITATDRLVYQLYNLTETEIAIVEGGYLHSQSGKQRFCWQALQAVDLCSRIWYIRLRKHL